MTKGLNSLHPKHLPASVSTFIGREKEIAKVKGLILENRLITLTGAGGSGKTRLALESVHKLLKEFNNNIWFIELASLTDSSLVQQKIASTLNNPVALYRMHLSISFPPIHPYLCSTIAST